MIIHGRRTHILAGGALSALAVLFSACADAPPPPTDTGVARELARHRARTIGQLSYRIELDVPEEPEEPIRGRSRLRFTWDDPAGHDLVLDFLHPDERVEEVVVNGAEAPWEPINDHVVISSGALLPGENTVEIAYVAGDEALNRNDEFLYALFVPDRAHFSLPVFDQPDLKASVRWIITVPELWRVVANGPSAEMSVLNGRATHHFLDTRPIPTYLFAFAAGRFQEEAKVVDGRLLRMYHRETDEEKVARNRDAILDLHASALRWLEEYTGIDYPFQKFAFVLVPSFQYGGMEHPGAVLYRQAGLMLDESATQGQILGRASVIAHETAHMWFGDLVTMEWFDDVWTKEVFANFMAAKIVHPSFPELDHDLRFLMAHHPSAYAVDRTAGPNPIRQPLENLRYAGTLYGPIIYQKAPIVMKHLESRVGEETFRDGLREYLETYAYGNASWPDLVEILDSRTDEDLTAWSRVWVEEPGRPRIVVVREGGDVVIRQEDPAGRGRIWPQTLEVRLGYGDAVRLDTVELEEEPVTLEGAAEGLRYVLPNASGVEYGGILLDPGSVEYLSNHVMELSPALARGAAWVTLWDQVLEERLDPGTLLDAALDAARTEEDELNLSRILGYLSTIYWRLLSAEERRARAPDVEAVLWEGVASDRPTTARASFFSTWRSVALSTESVSRLRRLWAGEERLEGLPLSESDQTALTTALALREVAGFQEILDAQEERIENPDRKARFRFVRPSLSADAAERAAFFESLSDPARRAREPWVLAGLGNLHHPLRGESSLAYVRPALEMLDEIQRTGDIFFPGRWLGATLGAHNEVRVAETVRSFLEQNPDLSPRLRNKVLQSADMLYRAARIVHGWEDP